MLPADRDRLIDAVVRVAERSLFAFAEPVAADSVARLTPGGWYHASVAFAGPFGGTMGLSVPVVLARQLQDACLGGDVDDAGAVRDLVGEFANMSCGLWLTTLDESSCFDLTRPEVVTAESAPEPDLAFQLNDLPLIVTMRFAAPTHPDAAAPHPAGAP